ncbi:hypothetical protein O1D37_003469 [Vibrio cholerae]|nr:hypothetical protein [Vibrio cholerae]EKF9846843.1 hypothetical protein [Vibrio cholerae]
MLNSVTMTTVFVRAIIVLGLIPNLVLAHTFTESTIIAEWNYRYNAASQSYSTKGSVEPTIPGISKSYIKEYKLKDYTPVDAWEALAETDDFKYECDYADLECMEGLIGPKPEPILLEMPFYDRSLNYAHIGVYDGTQTDTDFFDLEFAGPNPITLSLKNDDGDSLNLVISVMAIESAPATPHEINAGILGAFDMDVGESDVFEFPKQGFFLEHFSNTDYLKLKYVFLNGGDKGKVFIKDQYIAMGYSAKPFSKYPKAGTYRYKGIMNIDNLKVRGSIVKPYVDFTVTIEPIIKATSPVRDIHFRFDTGQVKANKRVPISIQSNSDRLKLSVKCEPGYEHNTEGCLLPNIYKSEQMLLTVQMDGKDIPNTMGFPQIINLIDTNPSYNKTKYAEIHLSEKENSGKPPKPGYYSGQISLIFELEF